MTEQDDKEELIDVTDTVSTERRFSNFWEKRTRLFDENADPTDPEYCFSTLFETWINIPIRPVATYRLLTKDRKKQTWHFWEPAGYIDPPDKVLQAKKVDLRVDQVKWVRLVYWYIPGSILALGTLFDLWKLVVRL